MLCQHKKTYFVIFIAKLVPLKYEQLSSDTECHYKLK